MKVERSKSGLPTITENGGGMTNTGSATVVCGSNGEALKPLFVPRGYSNGDHAVFVVKPCQTHLVHSKNIMIILSRTGNTFRPLEWDDYKAERLKDGNFSEKEKAYFDQVIPYCVSADTAVQFSNSWAG